MLKRIASTGVNLVVLGVSVAIFLAAFLALNALGAAQRPPTLSVLSAARDLNIGDVVGAEDVVVRTVFQDDLAALYIPTEEVAAVDEQYRRAVLGSDLSARLQSGMAVRKIAITSPKGGTGKTTVAVNLAVALALSGITTYLVDADGNAGALQYHLRMERVQTTMIGLLRREVAKAGRGVMGDVASGAAYLNAFTPLENLPTLRVLPGLITDDLGDEVLQQEDKVAEVIQGLYEAGWLRAGWSSWTWASTLPTWCIAPRSRPPRASPS